MCRAPGTGRRPHRGWGRRECIGPADGERGEKKKDRAKREREGREEGGEEREVCGGEGRSEGVKEMGSGGGARDGGVGTGDGGRRPEGRNAL